ncbi:hypothetical protein DEO72_LG7g2567 [Vigna unguiculata]|uniref:Neprosin PEP catalytic domain-containing protein n=1 Tax=Vigna unguiculata TaxID=3917 RepID=A0A4D6MKS5_VIGUN|nr:hypothetical protein DEO72_LG7g2567 [Vigna unguiculata]
MLKHLQRDNYHKTGCYNLVCPGFVQTHDAIYLGEPFTIVSSYGGPTFDFLTSITRDPLTKNWWLRVKNHYIGYYPAELFSNMTTANKVGWGGRTVTPHGTLSPPMGSGHFSILDFNHASYFRLIAYRNTSKKSYGPKHYQLQKYVDKPDCYNLFYYDNLRENLQNSILYGGPGGNCGD